MSAGRDASILAGISLAREGTGNTGASRVVHFMVETSLMDMVSMASIKVDHTPWGRWLWIVNSQVVFTAIPSLIPVERATLFWKSLDTSEA